MTIKVRPFRGQKDKWEVDIRIEWPDGTEYRERVKAPVSSMSAAKRWAEAREREAWAKGPPPPPSAAPEQKEEPKVVPTLKEFEDTFITNHAMADRQKASTIESKRQMFRTWLVPVLGHKRLDQIKSADIQHLKGLLSERNPKTANNVLCTLNVALKKAHEWELIPAPSFKITWLKTDNDGTPAFYDFDEYEKLLEGAKKAGPENELVVLLGGDAGLRLGEITGLEWPQVEFRRNVLIISQKDWHGIVEKPKSGRTREVPMTTRLAKALKAFKHLRGPRVLYAESGITLTERVMRNWIMSAERRAGMFETGRVHILRHTFCSHLAMRGVSPMAIKELAGHADLQTTQRYMHLSPSHKVEAIKILEKGHERIPEEKREIFGEILEKPVPKSERGV